MALTLSDPRLRTMPVRDCGEQLELAAGSCVLVDTGEATTNRDHALLRVGVRDRLHAAASRLPPDVVLLLIEGYRPAAEQQRRYAQHAARVAESNPGQSADWVAHYTARFVSPVDVAPHCTGGAVDITLATADGLELDMGGRVNAHRYGDEASCTTDAPGIGAVGRANRELLGRVMAHAGFVNYPTEWWHYSFGDRFWALSTGTSEAVYGPVDPMV